MDGARHAGHRHKSKERRKSAGDSGEHHHRRHKSKDGRERVKSAEDSGRLKEASPQESDDESVVSVKQDAASSGTSAKPLPEGPIYRPDSSSFGRRPNRTDSASPSILDQGEQETKDLEPAETERVIVQMVLDQPFATVHGKEEQYKMGLSLDIARSLGDRTLKPHVLALQPGL